MNILNKSSLLSKSIFTKFDTILQSIRFYTGCRCPTDFYSTIVLCTILWYCKNRWGTLYLYDSIIHCKANFRFGYYHSHYCSSSIGGSLLTIYLVGVQISQTRFSRSKNEFRTVNDIWSFCHELKVQIQNILLNKSVTIPESFNDNKKHKRRQNMLFCNM